MLINLGIPAIYEREIADHGLHTGLSGGWGLTVWIAFVLTESDHIKYKVEDGVERHADLLSRLTGQQIRSVEFNEQTASSRLARLSPPKYWEPFEAGLWEQRVEVYQLRSPGVGNL